MTSLMTQVDANSRAYYERMEMILSYMKEREFPKELSLRVQRYYKMLLSKKTSLDESAILVPPCRTAWVSR